MIDIESLFNFMDFPGSWLRSVESALNQPVGIVHTREPEQCIAFECDTGGTKNWKHMAAAEVKGRREKSNDRDDENFKNEEIPFHVLVVLAVLDNQNLITPTQRAVIVGVG